MYLLNLWKNQKFSPINLQESPQDEAFHQAKANLQVILRLDEKLEVNWSKNKQDGVEISFLSFSWGFGRPREEERECLLSVKLPLEACWICRQKLYKYQLGIVRE